MEIIQDPVEVVALMLLRMKEIAECYLGHAIKKKP
jgi:hypothetical protein